MASTDKVHFVVSEAQREEEPHEPFVADVNGRMITFGDPAEIAYQDLLSCETPMEFWRYTVSEEDRDYIAGQRMEAWRLGSLLKAFMQHYKAAERIDDDVRRKLGF